MALDFDGVDQYVNVGELGNYGSEMATNKPSFVFKLKSSVTDALMSLAGTFGDGSTTGIHAILNTDKDGYLAAGYIRCYLRDQDSHNVHAAVQSDTGVTDGNYHTLIVCYDGPNNVITIYLDSVLQTSVYTAQTTPDNFTNFQYGMIFGAYNDRGPIAYPYSGELCGRIYNKLLTQDEVTTIHYSHEADNIINGLVGRWLMNEKADGETATVASSVIDISGNGNHGTPVNSPVYRGAPVKLVRPIIPYISIPSTLQINVHDCSDLKESLVEEK